MPESNELANDDGCKDSPSIVCHQMYQAIYQGKPACLKHFLDTKKAIPLGIVLQNPDFAEQVSRREPGQAIDYQMLRQHVTVLKATTCHGHAGQDLIAFFHHLLELWTRWTVAAAEFCAFDIHAKMLRAWHIDKNDSAFNAVLETLSSSSQHEKQPPKLSRAEGQAVCIEWDRLHGTYTALSKELFILKTSDETQYKSAQLWQMIKSHEETSAQQKRDRLARQVAADAQRKKDAEERQQKAERARIRNAEDSLGQQLGQEGTQEQSQWVNDLLLRMMAEGQEKFVPSVDVLCDGTLEG